MLGAGAVACSGTSDSGTDEGVGGSTQVGVGGASSAPGGASGLATGGAVTTSGGQVTQGGGGAATTSAPGNTGGASAATTTSGTGSAGAGSSVGGATAKGGATSVGGATAKGGSTSLGGVTSVGGATAKGGATSVGGATAKGGSSSLGGATSVGGTTAKGGATSVGGAPSAGGTSAKGGTTSVGGTTSAGGTPSTGGTTAAGGSTGLTCPGETSGVTAAKIIYVSPTGASGNSGATSSAPKDILSALSGVQPGEMLLLAPGKYAIPYTAGKANTISLSKTGTAASPIKIVAASCGRAVIDFQFPEETWVQDSYGFSLTGSYYYFKGLDITRAGYQGAYVFGAHNTFENCTFHDNRNSGLEINEGGSYTTVINCDSYRNYDPKKGGSMADGFAPKQTQGPGNKFIGCRAWENSDDGYDAFDSPEIVTFENCWAFRNGIDVWGYTSIAFSGNGNGFKAGGNAKLANHKLTNCVAFGQPKKGFDQNNNTGGITLYNCTSYNNGTNYGLGGTLASGQAHVLKNNISLGGGTNSFGSATQSNNSWSSGFSVSAADFTSLDLTQATVARSIDGSIPKTTLFRLVSTSKLVNAGVNVGLPYAGTAPDLGAFELGQ